jgi:hypothetical protein
MNNQLKKIRRTNGSEVIARVSPKQPEVGRPKRLRTPPLQYWNGQTGIYNPDGILLGISNLSS